MALNDLLKLARKWSAPECPFEWRGGGGDRYLGNARMDPATFSVGLPSSEQFVQRCTSHPILASAWNEPIYPWNVQFDLHSCPLTEMPVMMTIIMTILFRFAPNISPHFRHLFAWQVLGSFGWFGKLIGAFSYWFPLISQIKPPLPSLAPAFLHMKDGKARELWNPADICIAHLSPHTSTFDLWILNFQIRTPIIACWTKSS